MRHRKIDTKGDRHRVGERNTQVKHTENTDRMRQIKSGQKTERNTHLYFQVLFFILVHQKLNDFEAIVHRVMRNVFQQRKHQSGAAWKKENQ